MLANLCILFIVNSCYKIVKLILTHHLNLFTCYGFENQRTFIAMAKSN